MDEKKERKLQRKELKKAYKRARRKYTQPWKLLRVLSGIMAVITIPAYIALSVFDNTVAAFFGGTFWELKDPDISAQYYLSDFSTPEEMVEYGLDICKQVEAEGAALLLNNDKALPLAEGAAVSCFSTSSVNLVYGGTGSGNIDASTADNLKTALEKAGLKVNDTLWSLYTEGAAKEYTRSSAGTVSLDAATVAEAPISVYTDAVKNSVADYGDAAIVVLSRVGGEGADLTYMDSNYLALDANEKDMMAMVAQMKAAGTVQKIVVLINSANPLQVDFLKANDYDVDAVLWIGDVGISGINAVGEILAGKVNPSGSLVDTYCYDNYSSPAMQNFTPVTYEGFTKGIIPDNASTYMLYQEGIYVGYKYYETRYEDAVMGTGNAGAYDYSADVAFPFGYGLSYTDFQLSNLAVQYEPASDRYKLDVTVTNTGDMAGKKTIQVYAQSPYTQYDVDNGVEKAAVALCGFDKTDILEPGKSQRVSVFVDRRDLASYDSYGAGTYILDEGDYYLTIANNAHEAVNNILAAKGYSEAVGMDAPGDLSMAWSFHQDALDTTTYATSLNGTPIVNRLSGGDINLYEGNGGQTITYLSRSDWQGTWPQTAKLALTDLMIKNLQDVQYDPANYETVPMPTLEAKNGKKLVEMIGKDYDDPDWQPLLDQLTFKEMVSLIGDSFHWTMPILSVQAPGSRDENGPQGLTASLFSGGVKLQATAFTSEDVMAATFNTALMTEIGRVMGNNCLEAEIAVLYGPGNNIHRTPYGGRNFEYYSEDGFLSGKMSAYEVKAIEDKGVHVVMKHFALNDCEQDRIGLGVWLNEQAAREIYLKAFQAAFEEGNAGGVMTAYTRWGCIWSGGNKGLMTDIMRGEWGSQGLTITDNILTTYCNGVDGVMAGGVSTFDAMLPYITNQLPKYKDDPVVVAAMKEACHHDLYAIANSVAMNNVGAGTTIKTTRPSILTILQILACASSFFWIVFLVLSVKGKRKFKRTEEYQQYKAAKKHIS